MNWSIGKQINQLDKQLLFPIYIYLSWVISNCCSSLRVTGCAQFIDKDR